MMIIGGSERREVEPSWSCCVWWQGGVLGRLYLVLAPSCIALLLCSLTVLVRTAVRNHDIAMTTEPSVTRINANTASLEFS